MSVPLPSGYCFATTLRHRRCSDLKERGGRSSSNKYLRPLPSFKGGATQPEGRVRGAEPYAEEEVVMVFFQPFFLLVTIRLLPLLYYKTFPYLK